MNNRQKLTILLLGLFLVSCQQTDTQRLLEIDQLRPAKESLAEQVSGDVDQSDEQQEGQQTGIIDAPITSHRMGQAGVESLEDVSGLPDKSFQASYNNMGVSTFINEVFGNQLGLSFSIDPDVQSLEELVSLRLVEEVSAQQLFQVARQTLTNYGVSIINQSGLYVFGRSDDATSGGVPIVISGRALPDVPPSHRPLFVFLPMEIVAGNSLQNWMKPILRGQGVTMQIVPETNSLLLQGKESDIAQVLPIIELLDQPALRGGFSTLIEPVFTDASVLVKDLEQVLEAQGYSASNRPGSGGIMLLPMKSTNLIVAMAMSEEVMTHVVEWAATLDRQNTTGIKDGIFSYSLRNADVEYLVSLLNQLDLPARRARGRNANNDTQGGGQRFIPDKNRNAVIFRGSGREWVELLPSIKDMDQPTPSVLVEVILAEVTLNDQDETGIEFIARSGDVTFSTLGGLGLGGNGLTATLNRAGETRAVLNAFYSSDRANIRSRPRLMVKSGQQASIDVGNEIPFVTSTSQSTENPDAPVIQTVNYRKTGVILNIEPVVHSSGYVDIRIAQELSEAQQTSTSSIDSPTIFNRKLETTVTLRDGGSVLLGGLISETNSDSDKGIKGLGRIPGFGRLFRADSKTTDKTELVMMVIPYIIENPDEAAEITDRALEFLQLTR